MEKIVSILPIMALARDSSSGAASQILPFFLLDRGGEAAGSSAYCFIMKGFAAAGTGSSLFPTVIKQPVIRRLAPIRSDHLQGIVTNRLEGVEEAVAVM